MGAQTQHTGCLDMGQTEHTGCLDMGPDCSSPLTPYFNGIPFFHLHRLQTSQPRNPDWSGGAWGASSWSVICPHFITIGNSCATGFRRARGLIHCPAAVVLSLNVGTPPRR